MKKKKRKKGSARLTAFNLIDALLEKPNNIKKLAKAFQGDFDEDPVSFYKQFIKPSAEKEVVVIGGDGAREALPLRINLTSEEEN